MATKAGVNVDLVAHCQNWEDLLTQQSQAEQAVQTLSKYLIDTRQPPPGPYRLFHYFSDVIVRIRELNVLFERIYRSRERLLEADAVLHSQMPTTWPGGTRYPPAIADLITKTDRLNLELSLDFQSMLIFSGMLLDEVAQICGHILAKPTPYRTTFDALAKSDGAAPFDTLWEKFRDDILWLDAVPRLFRNKMMVHRERPWQVGTNRSVYRLDWTFWVPIAAGWLSSDEQQVFMEEVQSILLKAGLRLMGATVHEAVYQGLDNISKFERDDRRALTKIAAEVGFATPSFQVFGPRIYGFITRFMAELEGIVRSNPQAVDLGKKQ
ncbi:hypothetical protein GCM10007301_37730 [Azorhizobium oxalatiphilum]|uniref:Uncharacterized protein n=1 Tax=Azorhizobium oxalatiphilum TaxID=980631 RepID=A0A917FGQ8_9HYPH|nr:hypothetical protein [Azorhizobium oxalatiphilum]GGF74366.1 hypothetical protein GCM10007301_37730 [Azorhizobium oxalatiphilum]